MNLQQLKMQQEADERLQRVESKGTSERKSFIIGVYRQLLGIQLGYCYVPIYAQKEDALAYHEDRCTMVGVEAVGGFAFIRVDKGDVFTTPEAIQIGRAKYDALIRIKSILS